ncbi:MAG: tetratricopeptide repeat protein [Clostridia bacterium]|nr:tetratricopeptide repeat protein [Clostridia bacterium]
MEQSVIDNINSLLEAARQRIYSDPDTGRKYLNEAMALSKRFDYKEGVAWATLRFGSFEYRDGHTLEAIEIYQEALNMFKDLKDYKGIVRAHYLTATVYALVNQFDLALNHYLEALPLSKTFDESYYGRLLNNLSNTYSDLKQYDHALEIAMKALAYMKSKEDSSVFLAYCSIAEIYLKLSDYKKALGFAEKALENLEKGDNLAYKGIANMVIAGAYKGMAYVDEALIVYNRALQFMDKSGNLQNVSLIHRSIGKIYLEKKEYQFTFKHLQLAMTEAIRQESLVDQSETYYLYAEIYEILDNHKKALDSYKHAVELEKKYNDFKVKERYKAVKVSGQVMTELEISESFKLTLGELRSTYLDLKKAEQTKLTDAFVEVVVDTIDMRDTTTAGHSKRLAKYALEMMKQLNKDDKLFKGISFDEHDMKAMYYAALLHDIGKLSVPENILLKMRRLSEDRMLAIEARYYNMLACLKSKESSGALNENEIYIKNHLSDDYEFICSLVYANYLSQEDMMRLQNIHNYNLEDCNHRKLYLIDAYELKHLSVKKGNLVASEWEVMRKHSIQTLKILQEIPWLNELKDVPIIAGRHHEKLDGSGYPDGLAGNELSIQVRILTIVDIFEALTASDRPYKEAMTIEQALEILTEEAQDGKLDQQLVDFFIKNKISHLCEDELNNIQAGH